MASDDSHQRALGASATGAATATVARTVGAPIIALFTCAAGSLDAITFLTAHVFTANMTGNTVLLGIYAGQGNGTIALHSLVALCSYVVGVAIGVVLTAGWRSGEGSHRALIRAVLVETAVLIIFTAGCFAPGSGEPLALTRVLVGCSAIAMGIQSATVMRLQLPGLVTTYITGTITTLVFGMVSRARHAEAREGSDRGGFERRTALQTMVFAIYGLAALTSAVLYGHWPSAVSLLPLLAIALVALAVARSSTLEPLART